MSYLFSTEDWEQRKLKDTLSLVKDGTHGTHSDSTDGPLLLSAKNIKEGQLQIDYEKERRISWDDYELIHSQFSLKKGDVLLTIVGTLGESSVLERTGDFTFQRSVAYLRAKEDLDAYYLNSFIGTNSFRNQLSERTSISAQPGVYLGDIKNINIDMPSQSEQKLIAVYFRNLNSLITLHQRELEKLKNIKKACLEKMFV